MAQDLLYSRKFYASAAESDTACGVGKAPRERRYSLDDWCRVWFNIPVRSTHADFVVLDPQRGLLVLEAKDWRLEAVASCGNCGSCAADM